MADTTATIPLRIFKTGATRIVEDDSMRGKTRCGVRASRKSGCCCGVLTPKSPTRPSARRPQLTGSQSSSFYL